MSRYRNAGQDLGGTLLSLKMCALILSVCVLLVWVFILKPWAIFPNAAGTAGGYGHGFNRYGIIELYFGGYLAVLLPILIAVYWLVWHHLSNKLDRDDGLHNHAARRLEPPAFQCGKLSLLLAVLVAAFLATMAFSPVINYSPQSYFPSTSTYSLLSISLGPHFTSKLYEDAVVYYCFLCGLACLGAAGHSSYKVRRVLHTRLRVPGDPSSSFHPFPHGISVGEIGLLLAGAALYAYWLYFWRWNYARIQTEAALGANPLYQVWARVLGHMTNLSFSLLLLPAARNSMWVSCFGVPFERAVKYHRGLGCVAYLCVTAHMLVWFVKWGMEGNLLNNMFNVHELRLSPTSWTNKATCSGEYPHWDNFTVPMVWIGWVALTAMVCLALLCRRRNYELFHYAHHFAWVYYIIALLHAWSFWYYASGGLMLYAIDRAIRLKRACTSTAIVSLDNIDGVTHFTFPHSLLHHYAGQYAFVNIPALSELEWHPFTISSPPDASEVTFHIKAMGPGTWTERLSLLAMHPIMTEVCARL